MQIPNSIAAVAASAEVCRRDLHANPELAYQETRTAGVVAAALREYGFDAVHTGIGGTGVVGVLHGTGGPGAEAAQRVMLRADMDALPIHERSGVPHASTTDGVMHACGHDGHTAMLLGAAQYLAENREFQGTVHFCFQPAEEGGAGAKAMIEDGLFARFPSRAVFGMHNWPGLPVGAFGIREGAFFARASEFRIDVRGQGGHAALPHGSRDPVVAAAALVMALQTVVARNIDPVEPAVLSVTSIHGGNAFNVIPDEVRLVGTVRSFADPVHAQIYARMEQIVADTGTAHGVEATVTRPNDGYPPTVNDAAMAAFSGDTAAEIAGAGAVHREFPPTLGGEDFAYLAESCPGAFILIGSGEDHPRLHTAEYDFNDETLPYGIAYWARLVQRALPVA